MNKWRPKRWENSYATVPAYDKDYNSEYHAFEAGASAILVALEKTAVCDIVVRDNESIRIKIGDLGKYNWQNGVWYFIPR